MKVHRNMIRMFGCGLLLAGMVSITASAKSRVEETDKKHAPAPLASQARASASIEQVEESLLKVWQEGRISEALRQAAQGVKAFPESGNLHYEYGRLLTATNQHEAAIRELGLAQARLPRSADVAAMLGFAKDLAGDESGARAAYEQALKIDPDHQDAKKDLADLNLRLAIRAGREQTFEAGSPGKRIQECLQMLNSGEAERMVISCVDPAALDSLLGKLGLSMSDREAMAQGLTAGFRQAVLGEGVGKTEVVGYLVEKNVEQEADQASVTVQILINKTVSSQDMDKMKTLLTSPSMKQFVSEEVWQVISGLEPDDQEAFFERTVGKAQQNLIPFVFQMQRSIPAPQTAKSWMIRDVVMGDPATVQMSFSQLAEHLDLFSGAKKSGARSRRASPYEIGYQIGQAAGVAIAVAVLIWLVTRKSRSSKTPRHPH